MERIQKIAERMMVLFKGKIYSEKSIELGLSTLETDRNAMIWCKLSKSSMDLIKSNRSFGSVL